MPFSFAWDESNPADTDLANTLGDVIRKLKNEVRERVDVEHFFPLTDSAFTGFHRAGSGRAFVQSSTPANNPISPFSLWIHDVTGEIRYDTGLIWKLFNAGVPSGTIVMWAGTIASIPSGWKLCDGTAGTPDLRSRFVRGAPAATDPGTTGGSDTHDHTMGGAPTSTQSVSTTPGPNVFVASDTHQHAGATGVSDGRPAYFEVAFIMKS